MIRSNRSVAGFCIAVIVLAAFLPGICALDGVLFEPLWVLLPDEVVVAVERPISLVRRTARRALVAPLLARSPLSSPRLTPLVGRLLNDAGRKRSSFASRFPRPIPGG